MASLLFRRKKHYFWECLPTSYSFQEEFLFNCASGLVFTIELVLLCNFFLCLFFPLYFLLFNIYVKEEEYIMLKFQQIGDPPYLPILTQKGGIINFYKIYKKSPVSFLLGTLPRGETHWLSKIW